jgi:hypothetical protein
MSSLDTCSASATVLAFGDIELNRRLNRKVGRLLALKKAVIVELRMEIGYMNIASERHHFSILRGRTEN